MTNVKTMPNVDKNLAQYAKDFQKVRNMGIAFCKSVGNLTQKYRLSDYDHRICKPYHEFTDDLDTSAFALCLHVDKADRRCSVAAPSAKEYAQELLNIIHAGTKMFVEMNIGGAYKSGAIEAVYESVNNAKTVLIDSVVAYHTSIEGYLAMLHEAKMMGAEVVAKGCDAYSIEQFNKAMGAMNDIDRRIEKLECVGVKADSDAVLYHAPAASIQALLEYYEALNECSYIMYRCIANHNKPWLNALCRG